MIDETLTQTVFAGLEPEVARRMALTGEQHRVARGEVVFTIGDRGASMYVITRGKVAMTRPAGEGRDNLLTVLGPGDLFGELTVFDPQPRQATATALAEAELVEFTDTCVRRWFRDEPDASWHFLTLLARRVRRTNDALENLLFSDIPRRVAGALLDLADKFGRDTLEGLRVDHDLTQEQLAHHIGASRESVNKALAVLATRGIIRLEPRSLVIVDVAQLRRKTTL